MIDKTCAKFEGSNDNDINMRINKYTLDIYIKASKNHYSITYTIMTCPQAA